MLKQFECANLQYDPAACKRAGCVSYYEGDFDFDDDEFDFDDEDL